MPTWLEKSEEGIWQKAKEAAAKTYKESDDAFWPVVTDVFKKMGGHVKHAVKSAGLPEGGQVQAEGDDSVQCRDWGIEMQASGADGDKWELDKPARLMWMPGGVTTIRAHYAKRPIELTVNCHEGTAKAVQGNFDQYCAANPKMIPLGCVEHHEEEAALRCVPGQTKFEWDANGNGIFCTAPATELGAKNVNGRIHWSWSPSFTTDAEFWRAEDKNGVLVFPPKARGSKENPAEVTGIVTRTDQTAPSIGSLTNRPAFRNMSPVRASEAEAEKVEAKGTSEGLKKGWEKRKNEWGESHTHENGHVNVEHDDTHKTYHVLNRVGVKHWDATVHNSAPEGLHRVVMEHAKAYVEAGHAVKASKANISARGTSEGVHKSWEKRRGELADKAGAAYTSALMARMHKTDYPHLARENADEAAKHAEDLSRAVNEAIEPEHKAAAHMFAGHAHRQAYDAQSAIGEERKGYYHHGHAELHFKYAQACKDKGCPEHDRAMKYRAGEASVPNALETIYAKHSPAPLPAKAEKVKPTIDEIYAKYGANGRTAARA